MGSRKLAQGLDGFAQVRDGFAKVPRKWSSHAFAKGLLKFATDSDITQLRDTNARWCGVASPVTVTSTPSSCLACSTLTDRPAFAAARRLMPSYASKMRT
eukprot:3349468-Prymnesium_polylepis.1